MYQTLVGIRVLCDWLDSPGLYLWVKFEADDEEYARVLDDIVIKRAAQLFELIQVKFTVDPFASANALSWTWLTERKGKKGKSLLEKWSSAAFNVSLEKLAELRLITNRRPDADFEANLHDRKVNFTALSAVGTALQDIVIPVRTTQAIRPGRRQNSLQSLHGPRPQRWPGWSQAWPSALVDPDAPPR